MSWFSSFIPAAMAPEPEAPQLAIAPGPLQRQISGMSVRSGYAESLPVETVRGPRAKAKAKLLPKWEAPSDDEADMNMDNASDAGDGSAAAFSRPHSMSFDGVGDLAIFDQAEPLNMPPLQSYEQTVLRLDQNKRNPLTGGPGGRDGNEGMEKGQGNSAEEALKQKRLKHELKMREKMLEEERCARDQELQQASKSGVNQISASRIIVGVAKVKLNMMRQKMKLYEESERMGTEDGLRARKLLIWTASLSFLRKFEEKMQEEDIMEAKKRNYLKNLAPPPPPPPPEEPPNPEDEELHDQYETMIRRYEKLWTAEGKKVLGTEKFEEIRNRTKDGPASKEKEIISAKCLQEAREVLNEVEYQELLRKAWRLRDDHSDLKDYDPEAFAREVANSSSHVYQASSKKPHR